MTEIRILVQKSAKINFVDYFKSVQRYALQCDAKEYKEYLCRLS